jgi:pimeloyl-ACP methyl ester carboxylesterase
MKRAARATLGVAGLGVCITASAAAMRQPLPPAMTDEAVSVNGVRLHYVSAGTGPLILFLHGFPEFWYAWKNQLGEFGKDHLAVAPDLRGYNTSEKPPELEQYRMATLVEDVRAYRSFLEGRKFVPSARLGRAIAWAFAIAHRRRSTARDRQRAASGIFSRLLASDPRSGGGSLHADVPPTQAKPRWRTRYATLVNIVLSAGPWSGTFTEDDKAAYIKAWSQPGALTGGLNYYRANRVGPPAPGQTADANPPAAMPLPDPSALVVKVPTLVIWGEKDTALLTQNLDGLDRFVPQLTIKRIPDGSHWVIHEKPAEVNGYIRDFLR